MQFLKQNTACTIMFGPFCDKSDGVTLKTDATTISDIDHASTGIFLSKAGGTAAIRHATVTASVADAYGMMKVTLDATDTNTLGMLDVLFAKAATYLPVHKSFMVVPANVHEILVSIGFAVATGVVTTGSSTTSIVTSSVTPTAGVTDQYKGRIVIFDNDTTTANLRGQATDITASSNAGVLTVSDLTTAPASGDKFKIY